MNFQEKEVLRHPRRPQTHIFWCLGFPQTVQPSLQQTWPPNDHPHSLDQRVIPVDCQGMLLLTDKDFDIGSLKTWINFRFCVSAVFALVFIVNLKISFGA